MMVGQGWQITKRLAHGGSMVFRNLIYACSLDDFSTDPSFEDPQTPAAGNALTNLCYNLIIPCIIHLINPQCAICIEAAAC